MSKPRCNRVTPATAAYMRLLASEGRPNLTIAQIVRVSASTVRYWLRRQKDVLPVERPRFQRRKARDIARRQRLASKLASKTVVRNGKLRPVHCTAASIAKELHLTHQIPASRWTVCRDLRESGFKPRVRPYVPTTAVADHTRRLRFVRSRATKDAFDKIVFTDEKVFTTNDYGSRTQWIRESEHPLGRENARFPPRVMVWAAIGPNFVTWKVLKNPEMLAGGTNERKINVLTSESYVRTCLPLIVPFLQRSGLVLQQDGAKAHTAKRTLAYLGRKGVALLESWPARSPDLNPIETLWAILQRRVSKRFPTTYQELVVAVEAELRQLRDNELDSVTRLCATFRTRCRDVAAKGGTV
jgi:transposase